MSSSGCTSRDVAILSSMPGVGTTVLATLLSEVSSLFKSRDYRSLRCLCGIAPLRDVRENLGGWSDDEPVKHAWSMPSTTGVVWRSSTTPSAKRSTKPCVREAIVTDEPCDQSQTACWPSLVRCSATKHPLTTVEQPPQLNCSNQPVSPGG